ncbi:alpha/beta hydrolase [Ascidiimonas aurantiaca]|uniref:alpha/beta fold hydrolase n=1 Tax=Ascidiimonas aurantiaca TaxID=1685432 RepID=UPI0030EBAA52
MKTLRINNVEIEFLLTGEKNSETIVFVHGLGANLSQFRLQQDYFSKNFKVIAINLRGHGKSLQVHKYTPSKFKLSVMSTDIIELLAYLKIDKVHFVGNSLGGNIGYEILRSHPHILKSLTTFGTTGQLNKPRFSLGILKFIYKIISPKAIGNLSQLAGQTKESKDRIREMFSKVNKITLLSTLPNIAKFDYLDVIKNSSVPGMIIKGEKDQNINRTIQSTINEFENRGNFKLHEIKDTGHFVNLDNPVLFNKVLEDFILNLNK